MAVWRGDLRIVKEFVAQATFYEIRFLILFDATFFNFFFSAWQGSLVKILCP